VIRTRAERLGKWPPYLFVEISRKKREAIAQGRDIIDFGVGDPDQPTPPFIVDKMAEFIRHPATHRYPSGCGSEPFREVIAAYFLRRFGVAVDPDSEIVVLIGSKEGIGHLPTAIVNPGEAVLIPEPGYPVYTAGTIFAGGAIERVPLCAENGWLPVLEDIPADVRERATLMFLNYPNNPTAACATLPFYEKVVQFGRDNDILIAHDSAYAETYFTDPPPSIMQVDGAKEVCIEFHSLSKGFNMTGWRIGFAVGHAGVIGSLAAVKDNLDSGPFTAIQAAAAEALRGIARPEIQEQRELYRRRRDILVNGLQAAGWPITQPDATFFVWAKCPQGRDSSEVAMRLLDEADVVVVPGYGFGKTARGFVRFSMTVEEVRTAEAVKRIAKIQW